MTRLSVKSRGVIAVANHRGKVELNQKQLDVILAMTPAEISEAHHLAGARECGVCGDLPCENRLHARHTSPCPGYTNLIRHVQALHEARPDWSRQTIAEHLGFRHARLLAKRLDVIGAPELYATLPKATEVRFSLPTVDAKTERSLLTNGPTR